MSGKKLFSIAAGVFITCIWLQAATVTIGTNHEILVDGKPFFPIMNFAQNTGNIAHQAGLGINTFFSQPTGYSMVYMQACKVNNVWGVVKHDLSAPQILNHENLLGWCFGDEPDLNNFRTPPSQVLSEYNTIKAADPNHPTFCTLTGGFFESSDSRYYDYCAATDIVGFDKYPIYGWCRKDNIYWVGDAQEELRVKWAKNQHPTYQWIECCKCVGQWCYYSERSGQGPFPNEIRCELWYAIAHGAKAIGYFTHSWRNDNCSAKGDQYYSQYQVTAAQETEMARNHGMITALTPVLCSANSTVNVTRRITSGSGRVDIMVKKYGNGLYIFAVNVLHVSSNNNQTVEFTVPGLATYGTSVTVYEENRSLTPSGEKFTDTFSESDPVHIYVIGDVIGLADKYVPPLPNMTGISLRNMPNPFKGSTRFSFYLPREEKVELEVFNHQGRHIRNLHTGRLIKGMQGISWNGLDRSGKKVEPGLYYGVLKTGQGRGCRQMMVLE